MARTRRITCSARPQTIASSPSSRRQQHLGLRIHPSPSWSFDGCCQIVKTKEQMRINNSRIELADRIRCHGGNVAWGGRAAVTKQILGWIVERHVPLRTMLPSLPRCVSSTHKPPVLSMDNNGKDGIRSERRKLNSTTFSGLRPLRKRWQNKANYAIHIQTVNTFLL